MGRRGTTAGTRSSSSSLIGTVISSNLIYFLSDNGVATAQTTAKGLMDQNIGIITVAVGGSYVLDPLSSPGFAVHLLDSSTDPNQLAQAIITDMSNKNFL